jgi:hypothetical protein
MNSNETEYEINAHSVGEAADIIGNAVRDAHDLDDDVALSIESVEANGDELAVTVTELIQ